MYIVRTARRQSRGCPDKRNGRQGTVAEGYSGDIAIGVPRTSLGVDALAGGCLVGVRSEQEGHPAPDGRLLEYLEVILGGNETVKMEVRC